VAETSLVKKLGIKPGATLLILHAPAGYLERLRPLPEGAELRTNATPGERYDFVQVFVASIAELNACAASAIAAFRPNGGQLWFCYPKKTGKIKTDITRDVGWEAVGAAGFLGVTLIAIDETWSSLRFRPRSEIKSLTRKGSAPVR
jgi:hypothetical protein